MSQLAQRVLLLAIAAFTALLYLPALSGPLLLDDRSTVLPIVRYAIQGGDWTTLVVGTSGPLGRPLANLSFLADASWFGAELRWWKATNLALHLVNGVLLCALFSELFVLAGVAAPRARAAAVLTAGLWLLHPLHLSTVMYLVQRMTEIATLFILLGMLLYVRGRQATAAGGGLPAIGIALFICTPLAALAKETGLLLPYLLVAIEFLLCTPQRLPRPPWIKRLLAITVLLPTLLALAVLASDIERYVYAAYAIRDFSPLERLLTEPRIVMTYLAWIVLPRRAAMGFYHDDVRVTHDLFNEPTALAAVLVCALLPCAIFWLRRRLPLAALGLAVFCIGHLLESTVFGLELMYEHRNYLPSIGILLSLAALVLHGVAGRGAAFPAVAALILMALVTAGRAQLWGDEGRLYEAFLAAHPASNRARFTVVEWYISNKDFASARQTLAQAQGPAAALHRLRLDCAQAGQPEHDPAETMTALATAPLLDNSVLDTLKLLARAAEDGTCALPVAMLADTLGGVLRGRMRPAQRYLLTIAVARLRQALGQAAAAQLNLTQAAAQMPDDPYPWYLAAEWAADAGDDSAAKLYLSRARARAQASRADFAAVDAAVVDLIER